MNSFDKEIHADALRWRAILHSGGYAPSDFENPVSLAGRKNQCPPKELNDSVDKYVHKHNLTLENTALTNVLFYVEGRPVYRGDILYHPDINRTGGRVSAEFPAEGDFVTVRTATNDNRAGAVPTVRIEDLSWELSQETKDRMKFHDFCELHSISRPSNREFFIWKAMQK